MCWCLGQPVPEKPPASKRTDAGADDLHIRFASHPIRCYASILLLQRHSAAKGLPRDGGAAAHPALRRVGEDPGAAGKRDCAPGGMRRTFAHTHICVCKILDAALPLHHLRSSSNVEDVATNRVAILHCSHMAILQRPADCCHDVRQAARCQEGPLWRDSGGVCPAPQRGYSVA